MELDAVQGEGVDAGHIFQQRLPRFARQTQDEVPAHRDAPRRGLLHRPLRAGEIVPPMHPQQGFVPARLDSVLDPCAPTQSGRVPMTRPETAGCAKASPYTSCSRASGANVLEKDWKYAR